ncbi:hypothetical protein D9615_004241 [Tricholomella constricta]|uniref:Rad51-like C-terminal domain-containing protein n=1 Tax=Tricholomella constricta TaxID=117010 RepID=A0A8H5M639_9AGAR|nr:hypothetical protein D9615_004241 [Tricholomella constricta]
MRLAALIPSIPAELVSYLDKCGIRTDTDLLFKPVIEVYRQLPPGFITLHDLEKAVARVAELASAPGISGADMLSLEKEVHDRAPILLSGVESIDNLLGGFGGRRVVEISGDRQSGKTALALNIVIRYLAEFSDAKVLWIDTTGDFSVEQAAHLLESFQTEAASTALERLQISLAFDIETAYNVLGELQFPMNLYAPTADLRTDPFVFDLGKQLFRAFITLPYLCPPEVINNTTFTNPSNLQSTNVSGARKPALGPSFTFLTDATLWLAKPREHMAQDHDHDLGYTVRSAEVLRSKTTEAI